VRPVAFDFRHLAVGHTCEQAATDAAIGAVGFGPAMDIGRNGFGFGSFHDLALSYAGQY